MNLHALLANTSSAPRGVQDGARDTSSGGDFRAALGQATSGGEGHLARSRPAAAGQAPETPAGQPPADLSTQAVTRQLKALGMTDAQLEQADMQALIERIQQQPSQSITEQLKALGMTDSQLQDPDMQALIERIQQQPDMARALQALVAATQQPGFDAPAQALPDGAPPTDNPALAEFADRLNLLEHFNEAEPDTAWRDALSELASGEGSPADALAGLLSAMVQAESAAGKPPLTAQGSGLSPGALRGAMLARQADPATTNAVTAISAQSSTQGQQAALNPSVQPLSADALLSALTVAGSDAQSQTSAQPLAGAQASTLTGSAANAAGLNPAQAAASAPAQASISTPLQSPAWPQQLGQQLAHFTQRGGEQQIQLQIHPAELGPLSIALKVSEHGGTQAHFLSAHAQVRQVVEQAIPQLREALAEQGITLGDTSVGEQASRDESALAENGRSSGAPGMVEGGDDGGEGMERAVTAETLVIDGRVDLYA